MYIPRALTCLLIVLLMAGCGAESDDGADMMDTRDDTPDLHTDPPPDVHDQTDSDLSETDADGDQAEDSDLDSDTIVAPSGTCDDVGERYLTLRDANQSCETAEDCVVVTSQGSCDCFWWEVVNQEAEDAAETLLAEAETCGITPDEIVGCQADVAPDVSVLCTDSVCVVSAPNSCLP